MVNLTHKLILNLLFTIVPFFLAAQQISDFTYKLLGNNVEVTYSLVGDYWNRYDVRLYSSFDNYTTPVQLVEGDVGENISPDSEKKIIWNALNELAEFEGNLSVKLKVKFIPFLTFNIDKGEKFRRGKSQTISWQATNPGSLNLELYKGDKKVMDIAAFSSHTTYNWPVQKKTKPGKDYRIKASGNGRYAFSKPFIIKKKVPLIIWVVPAAVAYGLVKIMGNKNNQEEPIALPVKPN